MSVTANFRLYQGDCLELLRQLEDSSIDALVTDPPAGIGFMAQDWDDFRRKRNPEDAGRDPVFGRVSDHGPRYGREPRGEFIAFMTEVMVEALRVLKPGAHALVWSIPRTSHWTATAMEDAGFEIRDKVAHLFGQGFPKNLDVSRAIDRMLTQPCPECHGHEHPSGQDEAPCQACLGKGRVPPRPVVRTMPQTGAKFGLARQLIDNGGFNDPERTEYAVTRAATPEAERWEGWGTALKPAREDWILARKPFEGTLAANVLAWGTGALNIGACRVGEEVLPATLAGQARVGTFDRQTMVTPERVGRWPANLVLSHTLWCRETGCADGCPVALLDAQSGVLKSGKLKAGQQRKGLGYSGGLGSVVANDSHGDAGYASRFFYCAKPSVAEKEAGLSGFQAQATNDGRQAPIDNPYQRGETPRKNHHPTVKPVRLMRYFCRLITPPGGTVLDPFMGSGTTGVAALQEGFGFVGIEREPAFKAIAEARILAARSEATA